jgi:nitrogen-specific signal transduction histidine kinase
MRDEQTRNYGDVLRHIVPEIHNALAVILGNAQLLLLGTTINPEDRAKLKAIERGSFRIQTLVEELMQERGFTSPPIRSQELGPSRRQHIRAVVP